DLTLRARVSAKTEEKKLELLYLRWKLERWQNARNRKANNDVLNLQETMDKELDTHRLEHGPKKRTIPSEYQKEIGEQYLANVEKELERWQNARNRRANNDVLNLQETMDKELDTHRLEHGPKKRIGLIHYYKILNLN
ncbi:hypothetical protein G4B88_025183, partial [Cannabis sativa]